MAEHRLKAWSSVFQAMKDGRKTFEFRRNDRDFSEGDVLEIREWDPSGPGLGRYTDYENPLRFRVTFILHGGRFGVPEGFCVMSITPILTG